MHENKNKNVHIRCTAEEKNSLLQNAKKFNMNLSQYILALDRQNNNTEKENNHGKN